jgi:hypothetical protein
MRAKCLRNACVAWLTFERGFEMAGAYVGEVRGWIGSAFGAVPRTLLVFDDRLVIVRGSRLAAASSSGTAEGVVLSMVTDAVLQLLRAVGRRRDARTRETVQEASPAELAAADPKSIVIDNGAITEVRLARDRTKMAGKHFTVTVSQHADIETVFRVSQARNPTLRTAPQYAALLAPVFGDRFTSDVVDIERAPMKRRTYEALVAATCAALVTMALACLLPWTTARLVPTDTAIRSFSVTANGSDVAGTRTLVLIAGAVVVFAMWSLARRRYPWLLLVSLGATVLVALDLFGDVVNSGTSANQLSDASFRVSTTSAVGLYLAFTAAVTAAATQIVLRTRSNQINTVTTVAPDGEFSATRTKTAGPALALIAVASAGVLAVSAFALQRSSRWPKASTRPTTSSPTTVAAAPKLDAVFTASDGRFRAAFPSRPDRQTSAGTTVYTSTVSDDSFSVWFVNIVLAEDLTTFAQQAIPGSTVSSREITFQHTPAVETVHLDYGTYDADVLLVSKGRLYRIEVRGPHNPPAGFSTFLASFRLTNPR